MEKKIKRATHLYKHTCMYVYLGLFLEGDANMVTVVAIGGPEGLGIRTASNTYLVPHTFFCCLNFSF